MQYNIRLRIEDISYAEFARLLRGIMPETPLGTIISIRSETDKETLKRFSSYENKIRKEWNAYRNKLMLTDEEYIANITTAFQDACRQAFCNQEEVRDK